MNEIFDGFDWKNGEFDAIQEAYLKQYAQEQIDVLLRAGETDTEKAEYHLKRVYAQLGKQEPEIVWYDSPVALVSSVWDPVSDSVIDPVRASVWDPVGASVWDPVWASVWDSVGASVRASVWDSVGASVRASVWDSVGASVRASVGDSVGDSVRSWGQSWASRFRFFNDHFEKNALEDWCIYSENVNGGILADNVAHVVKKPVRLVRNPSGRLHYDHGKAIEWADGTGFFYLGGVEFDEETYWKIVNQEITLETLGDIENADQRAVAVQMLRPDLLLKQVNAKLIHVGQKGTELYRVENFMDTRDTEYCMKMEHPSINGKFYIEWVEPKIGEQKNADLAQATAFGMTVEEYLQAEVA